MTDESIPSGALKVAEAKRLASEFARAYGRLHFARQCGGPYTGAGVEVEAARVELHAAIDALASPSPATGALSEPLTQLECEMLSVWQDAAPWSGAGRLRIVRAIEAAHGITAAPQVEPEGKHG